ncbi:MAG: hypothetical protein KUA37_05295 [Desulfomicrobium sp.]|nr:hypothetical protein [Pseudomonadota bacterium]MBV1711406.1 hypothetical protein [Desulfomicrobium sp.]MBU4570808.1 hypothetical protein [Pseudomonadota bacterium]MBU4595297.1 hypothetical protein [Pseudomonadota bacterium]MBV1720730.1 hypothetical protein [Desulfomicrobium sp.]
MFEIYAKYLKAGQAMSTKEQKIRKWKRHACLFPCGIICGKKEDTIVLGRILNMSRQGFLIETDCVFSVGDTLSIIASPGREVDGYDLSDSYQGLVRWGQTDTSSLMGAYSVGVELAVPIASPEVEAQRSN